MGRGETIGGDPKEEAKWRQREGREEAEEAERRRRGRQKQPLLEKLDENWL